LIILLLLKGTKFAKIAHFIFIILRT